MAANPRTRASQTQIWKVAVAVGFYGRGRGEAPANGKQLDKGVARPIEMHISAPPCHLMNMTTKPFKNTASSSYSSFAF